MNYARPVGIEGEQGDLALEAAGCGAVIEVPDVPWLGVVVAELGTGQLVRANAAFLDLVGYTAEDVAAGRLNLTTLEAAAQLGAEGRDGPLEKTYRRSDGTVRHAWVTGMDLPGHPGLAISYVFDLTEQQRTVAALRESEERARRFAEASFEGIVLHEAGRIVDLNEAALGIIRARREELIGRPILDFADPSSHGLIRENIERQYREPYEVVGRRADGTTFAAELLGKPVMLQGRMVRVTALRDLTERKRTEEALKNAEIALRDAQKLESLGLLAGGIAHDFNNLLGIVLGFAALAARELPETARARSYLVEIERAAHRGAELARQMLVYSGRSPKTVAPTDLDAIVRDIARLVVASSSKKVSFELVLGSAADGRILGDRAQVQQVVMNLLTNAVEAIGGGRGRVRVTTSATILTANEKPPAGGGERLPAGRYRVLEVTDDGCGMDEATVARIFDPFFSTKATGRGLGLSSMLGILRGHRAGLEIESALDEGSTFRVYLPVDVGPPSREAAPLAEVPSGARTRGAVLVVDDEIALLKATSAILRERGHRVLEAHDGVEALRLFREHRGEIAVVLLDLLMPELDGRETLGALRKLDPLLRIVLTSGFDAHEVLDGVRGVTFLAKPFTAKGLLAAIEAAS